MLCQKCNKKVATVFISTVVNGKNSQMYLCTDCAKEFHDSMSPDMQIPFPINDILSNMEFNEDAINNLIKDFKGIEDKNVVEGGIDIDNTKTLPDNSQKVDITCSVCNTSFKE